jgi:hypothetical protein
VPDLKTSRVWVELSEILSDFGTIDLKRIHPAPREFWFAFTSQELTSLSNFFINK